MDSAGEKEVQIAFPVYQDGKRIIGVEVLWVMLAQGDESQGNGWVCSEPTETNEVEIRDFVSFGPSSICVGGAQYPAMSRKWEHYFA